MSPNKDSGDWEYHVIHEIAAGQEVLFQKAWETKIFLFPAGQVTVNKLKLEVANNAGGNDTSIAQFILYE